MNTQQYPVFFWHGLNVLDTNSTGINILTTNIHYINKALLQMMKVRNVKKEKYTVCPIVYLMKCILNVYRCAVRTDANNFTHTCISYMHIRSHTRKYNTFHLMNFNIYENLRTSSTPTHLICEALFEYVGALNRSLCLVQKKYMWVTKKANTNMRC